MAVAQAVPASQIVSVVPSVLSAGGTALDLTGLILTNSTRVPIGQLLSFPTSAAVSGYFGAMAHETALADVYFLGFADSTKKPGALFFYQYPWQAPVAGYLWGGSLAALSLAGLQTLSGVLTITIDGTPVTSTTINLATATSFSQAAQLIQTGLAVNGPQLASVTAAISGTTLTVTAIASGAPIGTVTGSITGTTLTVTAVGTGVTLQVGQYLSGGGITAGTTITAYGSGSGGVGTYTVSTTQTSTPGTINISTPVTIAVGDYVTGTGVTSGTSVTALGTGAGGTGTYTVNNSQTVASTTLTIDAPAVVYDSVSSAFILYSGSTGANSSMSYASGTLAASLNLTQAAGAVLSPGAALATPSTILNDIVAISMDWASFMTSFEPDTTDKEAFAAWENAQNNRFAYVCWDSNVLNTGSTGPSPAVAAITAAGYSGTIMVYSNPQVDPAGGQVAAFIMGYAASLDFTAREGRATAAFKSQGGLSPQVTSGTVAGYLQGYGLNFYGEYTTANEAFTFLYPGSIVGQFAWMDSYYNQIWLNQQLQLALMVLLTTAKAIPYNPAGYGMVSASCQDPINEAANFGVFQENVTLSAAQIVEVNGAAGVAIANILQQQGWYLQVSPASAQVRSARGSPPITFWYVDGGSIHKISLASIEVQ